MKEIEKLMIDKIMMDEIEEVLKEDKLIENIENFKKINKNINFNSNSNITDKLAGCFVSLEYCTLQLKVLQKYKTSNNLYILSAFISEIGETVKKLAKEVE